LTAGMGAEDPAHPDYQVGDGCLVDQLMGQYIADYCGLGALVSEDHIRKTLQSIHRYNYRKSLDEHQSVQRTYALNDESGLLVCDYGKGKRPQVPFPYFSEVWTGLEYQAAALMMSYGMVREGVETVENTRRRYDGERRNPWDETECGPHYARAMSAWSTVTALSGFRYQGPRKVLVVAPAMKGVVQSFWSTGMGWGSFTLAPSKLSVAVTFGKLPIEVVELAGTAGTSSVRVGSRAIRHTVERGGPRLAVRFAEPVVLAEGEHLTISL
jgi:non-lysosomal glucosylceramidase